MNIAIVDDEDREIDALSEILREYAAAGKLHLTIHPFGSGEEILSSFHPYAYTAIFMDIYMGGMTGIEAAKKLLSLDRNAMIIFLTSSGEHMPEAFHMHVYDYIEKPADKERLFKVMDDMLMRKTALDAAPKLIFSCDKMTVSLSYSEIVYVKTTTHNYLEIMDADRNIYITRLTFSGVSGTLEKDSRFLLILRGILINMEYIHSLDKGICRLETGEKLPVNIRKAAELEKTWRNYIFDRIRGDRNVRRR